MLAGASSLNGARLGVDMLKRLPLSRRKLLGWLDLDAYYTCHEAIVNCLKALTDCQQLKSFSLKCTHPYWGPIELNLRHLVQLSHCKLYFLPAPSSLLLPRCRLELVLFNHQIAAWSKLWPQVQHHVCCIEVGGDSYLTSCADSALQLGAWPEAIGTFHGLQFLQIICREVSPYLGQGVLDLALVAYIPHVSLRSEGDLHVVVSAGSWDLLDLQSKGAFDVVIVDAEAFMKSTCAFYFTYTRKERPQDLIQMMWEAAIATGNALYEDDDTYSPLSWGHNSERDSLLGVLSNCEPHPSEICYDAFLKMRIAYKQCRPALVHQVRQK